MPIRQLGLDGNKDMKNAAKTLEINTDSLTNNQVKLLAEGIIDIKIKHSPFTRFPMKDDETEEEYEKRAQEELKADKIKRKPTESVDEYVRRLYTSDVDRQEMLYDMLRLLARTTGQSDKVSDEALGNSSAGQCRKIVADILEEFELD